MEAKVANLHTEVFTEIMEQEMALARLESENLGSVFPSEIVDQQQRSLLGRMNTLKMTIATKKKTGVIPKYDKTLESEMEEESEGSQGSLFKDDVDELTGE